jgi:hypothetical protein
MKNFNHSLIRLIKKQTHCSYSNIFMGDKQYDTLTKDQVIKFLEYDLTDRKKYESEYWDCDNFSLRTMSNAQIYFLENMHLNPALGIVWTERHALNFYLDNNSIIHYIEPQTDCETEPQSKIKFVLLS